MFECTLLVAVEYVRLSSEVRLKAHGSSIGNVITHWEDDHLRKYRVLEFLYTLYLATCLDCTWSLHSHESNNIACSHSETVYEVARNQNSSSSQTCIEKTKNASFCFSNNCNDINKKSRSVN